MNEFNSKKHWENIYQHKRIDEVSWYQTIPKMSLSFIEKAKLDTKAKIIDIGAGESFLVDHLLNLNFTNITALDISATAIDRVKKRLGASASLVNWIVSNILDFSPSTSFNYWNDRAAFHFLTQPEEIEIYINLVTKHIAPKGVLTIGAFSEIGPTKCSGIPIQQYSKERLSELFSGNFKLTDCIMENHQTPFNTVQNFVFCSFVKI